MERNYVTVNLRNRWNRDTCANARYDRTRLHRLTAIFQGYPEIAGRPLIQPINHSLLAASNRKNFFPVLSVARKKNLWESVRFVGLSLKCWHTLFFGIGGGIDYLSAF